MSKKVLLKAVAVSLLTAATFAPIQAQAATTVPITAQCQKSAATLLSSLQSAAKYESQSTVAEYLYLDNGSSLGLVSKLSAPDIINRAKQMNSAKYDLKVANDNYAKASKQANNARVALKSCVKNKTTAWAAYKKTQIAALNKQISANNAKALQLDEQAMNANEQYDAYVADGKSAVFLLQYNNESIVQGEADMFYYYDMAQAAKTTINAYNGK